MSATPDGLDVLMQQRATASKRARRAMPPPRHPRSQDPTDTPDPVVPAGPVQRDTPSLDDVVSHAAHQDEATRATGAQDAAAALEADPPGEQPPPARVDPAIAPPQAGDAAAVVPPRPGGPIVTIASPSSPNYSVLGTASDVPTPTLTAAQAGASKVKPVTVSLDGTDIDWLDDLRILGMQSRPKVDIGRSSIVRLALSRLREQMAAEEIRDHLQARAAQATGSLGRRRL